MNFSPMTSVSAQLLSTDIAGVDWLYSGMLLSGVCRCRRRFPCGHCTSCAISLTESYGRISAHSSAGHNSRCLWPGARAVLHEHMWHRVQRARRLAALCRDGVG
eukprot:6578002-Prymnesium_polylepis.1